MFDGPDDMICPHCGKSCGSRHIRACARKHADDGVGLNRGSDKDHLVSVAPDIRHGYKILTHDWRPPIQGGEPLCDGVLPVTLPTVALDTSDEECGAGYNYCGTLVEASRIAGWWGNGRPARRGMRGIRGLRGLRSRYGRPCAWGG
jgi:hypothetical protein